MTMREVDIALKKIAVRKHNAHALRARLHGVEIPFIGMPQVEQKPPLSPAAQAAAERSLNDAIERKLKEMKRES